MCGIVGVAGKSTRLSTLLDGLRKLEYRGSDSAGVAYINSSHQLISAKTVGTTEKLLDMIPDQADATFSAAIGHSRWATHGEPSKENAHPHLDCSGSLAVVHNGIIENFEGLKDRLVDRSHVFLSSTDSEVIAHLIEGFYNGDLIEAVKRASKELEGAYAIAVVHKDHPGLIVVVRKGSPLVIAHDGSRGLIASDVTPIIRYTREVIYLEDGDIACLNAEGMKILTTSGEPVDRPVSSINWDEQAAEKSGHDHFMLKEMLEQPQALRNTIAGRIRDSGIVLAELSSIEKHIQKAKSIKIVACGTSYHAGLVFKRLLDENSNLDSEIDVASEFRYRKNACDHNSLIVAISQSGETADTLEFLRQNKEKCSASIAVTNTVGSTITREVDASLFLNVGPEIGVAATKTYTAQLLLLYMLATSIAQTRGFSREKARDFARTLSGVPDIVEQTLVSADKETRALAEAFRNTRDFLFIGRGYGYPTALEGALKLKEISYVNASAVQAGELKHGHIALLDESFPVFAVAPTDSTKVKMASNIMEVKTRGAPVILLTDDRASVEDQESVIKAPFVPEWLFPIAAATYLQFFAYHMAVLRELDPDRPRNLAKSVTVE